MQEQFALKNEKIFRMKIKYAYKKRGYNREKTHNYQVQCAARRDSLALDIGMQHFLDRSFRSILLDRLRLCLLDHLSR